ncbi:MAG: hypothetical protein CMF51_01185 [Legionellales bacterium]|nr:hypothetical protein [Legionellales bacterium]
MGSITILAPAVGPLLGALIIEHYHWRYIFGMLFLWGAITSAALCFQMKETLKHSTPIQIKSILHDYPSIMRDQTYMRYCMTACALFFGLEAWLLSSPFLVIHTYHLTSVYLGIAQLIIFSSYILGMQYCRYAITRYPSTTLMNHTILIAFFSAASLCGLTYWMTTPPIWSIIALIALTGFGSAATSTPLTRLAMEAHPATMGKKMALYSFCFSLTGVLGAILLTMIPIHTPFPMACLMTLGALLALLLLQSPWPQPQTPTFLKTL